MRVEIVFARLKYCQILRIIGLSLDSRESCPCRLSAVFAAPPPGASPPFQETLLRMSKAVRKLTDGCNVVVQVDLGLSQLLLPM